MQCKSLLLRSEAKSRRALSGVEDDVGALEEHITEDVETVHTLFKSTTKFA